MKERPILFSAPMIQAILADKKTQTRRVLKPQPHIVAPEHLYGKILRFHPSEGNSFFHCEIRDMSNYLNPKPEGVYELWGSQYGEPGDRLWVRETFFDNFADRWNGSTATEDECGCSYLYYRADGIPDLEGEEKDIRWISPRFMPRWASRITLEICSVRVERLKEISESDAQFEGAKKEFRYSIKVGDKGEDETIHVSYRGEYANLWNSINGDKPGYSWTDNPFVWVIEFRRIQP